MFEVKIENNTDGRVWIAKFPTQEEAQEWLDQQLVKEGRLQERQVQAVDDNNTPKVDEDGSLIMVTVPAQATFTIVDLTQDTEWLNNQAIIQRMAEYPRVQEILHVMMDHGVDSPEYQEMLNLRAAVKAKYPKV